MSFSSRTRRRAPADLRARTCGGDGRRMAEWRITGAAGGQSGAGAAPERGWRRHPPRRMRRRVQDQANAPPTYRFGRPERVRNSFGRDTGTSDDAPAHRPPGRDAPRRAQGGVRLRPDPLVATFQWSPGAATSPLHVPGRAEHVYQRPPTATRSAQPPRPARRWPLDRPSAVSPRRPRVSARPRRDFAAERSVAAPRTPLDSPWPQPVTKVHDRHERDMPAHDRRQGSVSRTASRPPATP